MNKILDVPDLTQDFYKVDKFLHDHVASMISEVFTVLYRAADIYQLLQGSQEWTTFTPDDRCPDIGVRGNRGLSIGIEVKSTRRPWAKIGEIIHVARGKYLNRVEQCNRMTKSFDGLIKLLTQVENIFGTSADMASAHNLRKTVLRESPYSGSHFAVIVAKQDDSGKDCFWVMGEIGDSETSTQLPSIDNLAFEVFRVHMCAGLIDYFEKAKTNPTLIAQLKSSAFAGKLIRERFIFSWYVVHKASKNNQLWAKAEDLLIRFENIEGARYIDWCFKGFLRTTLELKKKYRVTLEDKIERPEKPLSKLKEPPKPSKLKKPPKPGHRLYFRPPNRYVFHNFNMEKKRGLYEVYKSVGFKTTLSHIKDPVVKQIINVIVDDNILHQHTFAKKFDLSRGEYRKTFEDVVQRFDGFGHAHTNVPCLRSFLNIMACLSPYKEELYSISEKEYEARQIYFIQELQEAKFKELEQPSPEKEEE